MKPVLSKKGFKNRKVLVFGLGLLGGGVATTNWLIKQEAKVIVTDLKEKKALTDSLKKIKGKVKLKLGGHSEADIKNNDVIVVNPDVSINNQYIQLAFKLGKQVENEATIFFKNFQKPIIAVTGTRGKTTTTNWTAHFLKSRFKASVAGNSLENPFLKVLDKRGGLDCAAVEIPSFALEFFNQNISAPDVAVVTNIYQDHLNRHQSLENYAGVKANLFRWQTAEQNLILNYENSWTKFFLKQKPKSVVWFFSNKVLPKKLSGVFALGDSVYFQKRGKKVPVLKIKNFSKVWGEHNLYNLLAGSLAAHLGGVAWTDIQKRIRTLPQVPFRQEKVFDDGRLKIINDTTATSPDGGIAAIKRFASPSTILIAGGTDRQLDYSEWAKVISKLIKPENIIFLSGSATKKMIEANGVKMAVKIFETLENCVKEAVSMAGKYQKSVILFSPAAKSFEKFKNEYDRGEQFNKLVKKFTKGRFA